MFRLYAIVLLFLVYVSAKGKDTPHILMDANWTSMLEGQWMVKFYAPWCPACQAMSITWDKVAGWGKDLGFRVGKIDVTENPGLSGRFLVTALPTIYHVKDGVFREYEGPRGENDFVSFVDDKKYEKIEPMPWYKSPTSVHMSVLGAFFKFSMWVRNIHNALIEEYGVPWWGSYLLFAAATVVVGLLLGLILVVICDIAFPPKPPPPRPLPSQYDKLRRRDGKPVSQPNGDTEHKDEESDILDDRVDAKSDKDDKKEESVKDKDSEGAVRKRKAKAKTTD